MEPFDIISWVIVSAFTVILVITLAGMIGLVKFKYKEHLNKLFIVLIVEIIGMGFLIYTEGKGKHSEYLRQAQLSYEKAIGHANSKQYDEALSNLSEILRLEDDSAKFHVKNVFLQRGNILFNRKLYADAITPYAVYTEIVQDDAQALARYGRALRAVHRYEDARIIYERALALAPNDYYILNGLQNCLRRQAGFLLDTTRKAAGDKYFQQARVHIASMLNIAKTATEKREKKILNAELALARLNWQWERFPESIALFEEIISNNPDHSAAHEDLAAIYLEYAQAEKKNEFVVKSLNKYRTVYSKTLEDNDKIFIGSGIAEATAYLDSPSKEDIMFAKKSVSLSIAKNTTELDDPYPFYAASVLHHKSGDLKTALKYIDEAIRAEVKRADNIYTFDYKRLALYERLKATWLLSQKTARESRLQKTQEQKTG